MLKDVITPELLDRVADAWLTEGRRLAVIAVDMDCGNPELLDLTALALQRDRPHRVARYIDYLMASSPARSPSRPCSWTDACWWTARCASTSRCRGRSWS